MSEPVRPNTQLNQQHDGDDEDEQEEEENKDEDYQPYDSDAPDFDAQGFFVAPVEDEEQNK